MNKEDLTFDYLPQKKEVHLYQHPKIQILVYWEIMKIPSQKRICQVRFLQLVPVSRLPSQTHDCR